MVALLFARILEHYQSALLLAECGSIPSARSLLRVMCEATFSLAACGKDPAYLDEYVNDDRLRRLAMFNALLQIPAEGNAVPPEELAKLKVESDELRANVRADKQQKLIAFETAKRAGLLDFYRLFYVPFSNTVHSAVRDLDTHVVETGDGTDIAQLRWGPSSQNVEDTVDAAIQIFFAAAHAFLQIFPQPERDAEFEALWAEQKARLQKKTEEWKRSRANKGTEQA
jgi:hypothetical protein